MSRDLDLAKVQTPEGVLNLLRECVEQYRCDAGNMASTAFLDNRTWLMIAGELEAAGERIERGLKKLGYPSSTARRVRAVAPGPMTELDKLAAEVAIIPPPRRHESAVSAYIPWDLIQRMRAELEKRGFDWRAGHKKYREVMHERAVEREARRAQS